MKIKTKTKIKIKTILIITISVALALLYNYHKDQSRIDYAQNNDCSWVVSGSHDVCR